MDTTTPGLACPLDHEYSEEEWRAFVQCAREGMESGKRLHHEFSAKLVEKGIPAARAEQAITSEACLSVYEKEGLPRLGLWNPRSEMMVIGTVPAGLILTAFRVPAPRARVYLEAQIGQRWLRT